MIGRRAPKLLSILATLALGAGAAGCGGDDTSSATVVQAPTTAVTPATGPDATLPTTTTPSQAPAATSPSTSTTPTATTGVPPQDNGGTPAGGEQGPGGAGDEEAARVPAAFTTAGASLSPSVVTLPAFLAIEVSVTAKGGAETLTISAPGGGTLQVGAGKTATKRLQGLKPGDYAVTTAGGGKATLHVITGGAPGP